MNQRSVLRAVFAALLIAVATGADAQGFGSVSSGARLPEEAMPDVAGPEAATPAVSAPPVAAFVPESPAATPDDATTIAADASGPFGAADAGIDSPRPGYQPADLILVRKAERRLYLMRANRIIAEYPIRLGLNPSGHKEREGDFRTPEGLYQLVGRNPRSDYFLSLEVSYPNDEDRAQAKKSGVEPGGLIMIHGQPNLPRKSPEYYEKFDWTNGCIAVSNSDMVDIWLRTQLGTLVVIRP